MKKKLAALVGAVVLTGTLVVIPAAAANAAFDRSLGSGSCAAAAGFVRTNAKGSNVSHYVDRVLKGMWNNGNTYITRTSNQARKWSSSSVHGSEGNGQWVSALSWAQTGCGLQ